MLCSLARFCLFCSLWWLGLPLELRVGGAGWALQFDGSNDFAQFLEVPPCENLTIELWARPLASQGQEGVLLSRHTPQGLFCFKQHGGVTLEGRGGEAGVWTQPVARLAGWHHWALVFHKSQLITYLNGESVGVTSSTMEVWQELCRPGPSLFPWLLGAAASVPGSTSPQRASHFSGQVDEVRFWRAALSREEIRKWMFVIPRPEEPSLLQRWGFDDQHSNDTVHVQVSQLYTGNPQGPTAPAVVASSLPVVGRPVAVEARAGRPAVAVRLCAALLPAAEGVAVRVVFEAVAANSTAGLLGSEGEAQAAYGVPFAVELTRQFIGFSPEPMSLFCAHVHFLPKAPDHQILPFNVLSQGPGAEVQMEQGWLDVVVHPSFPPVAGLATALITGGHGYAILGPLTLPQHSNELEGSGFSFSLWLDPLEIVGESYILSHQTSAGEGLLFGFHRGRYRLWMSCQQGCGPDGTGTSDDSTSAQDEAFFPPSLQERFSSGKTGAQVMQESGEPHILTVTIHCQAALQRIRATARMYVDGHGIGEAELKTCWSSPSPASDGDSSTAGSSRGEVWLLGAAYRHKAQDLSLEPEPEALGLLPGIFDDLRFYRSVLSQEDVQTLVSGGAPQEQEQNLLRRYTFDNEPPSVCLDRQLMGLDEVTCSQLGLVQGEVLDKRSVPQQGLRGDAVFVPSPFSRVAGSPLPKAIEIGKCDEMQLAGSDPDGDGLVFVLPTSPQGVSLEGSRLHLCPEVGIGGMVEVPFDVCNHQGVCSSNVSGLSKAVFGVFGAAPVITQVQHDTFGAPGSLRLLFSMPISAPALSVSTVGQIFDLTPPEGWSLREAYWELDKVTHKSQVLRLYFNMDGWYSWWFWGHPNVAVRIKKEGMVRDENHTSLPSTAVAPSKIVRIECKEGESLEPNVESCKPCWPGRWAKSNPERKGANSCQGCGSGKYQPNYAQLSCDLCPLGRFQPGSDLPECQDCQDILPGSTTLLEGSTNTLACICPAGSAVFRDVEGGQPACQPCGEGLQCLGGREANHSTLRKFYTETLDSSIMAGWVEHIPPVSEPTQVPGFSAGSPPWEGAMPPYVVRCRSQTICPGGPLGSCPPLRTGRACAICVPGSYEDGAVCRPCFDRDPLLLVAYPLLVALVASFGLLWLGTQRPSIFREQRMTTAISFSVFFAALQVLGSLTALGGDWPEPMPTLQSWLGIFILSIDRQSPQCDLESFTPLMSYLASLAVYPMLAVLLSLALLCRQLWPAWRVSLSQAVNMHGVGLMAMLTSISVLGLAPLKCRSNPDGTFSPDTYRSVVCWKDQDHLIMVIAGISTLAVLVLGFLSLLIWATLSYPTIIVQPGGGEHMVRFRFLFGQHLPNRYFFGLLFAFRKLFVALAPMAVVDLPQVQLVLVLLVIASSMGLQCALWPWRTFGGNVIDACTALFVMIVISAGFMLAGASQSERVAQRMILVGLSATLVLFVIAIIYCCQKLLLRRRYYRMFLSHHKVGAGLLARWMKLLLRDFGLTRVFLDSDNLKQLDKLVDIVSHDCDNVVVLLTRETLTRPWCAMELAAAFKSGTPVVPVICDGFDGISDEFLDGLPDVWTTDQQATMTSGGVTLLEVREAYEDLRLQEAITLDRVGARVDVHLSVVRTIISRCSGGGGGNRDCRTEAVKHGHETSRQSFLVTTSSSSAPSPLSGVMSMLSTVAKSTSSTYQLGSSGSGRSSNSKSSRVAILNDMSVEEPACGCRVLQIMLQELLQEGVAVKCSYEGLKPCCVLVTLRPGVLRDLEAATAVVLAAEDQGVKELTPLLLGDFAEFPTSAFWEELQQGRVFQPEVLAARKLTVDRVERAYRRLFNTLAMRLSGHASTQIQSAEVAAMASRLHAFLKKTRGPATPGYTTGHTSSIDTKGGAPDSRTEHTRSVGTQGAGEDHQRKPPGQQTEQPVEITQPRQVQHAAL